MIEARAKIWTNSGKLELKEKRDVYDTVEVVFLPTPSVGSE